jgi:hypothetical protein
MPIQELIAKFFFGNNKTKVVFAMSIHLKLTELWIFNGYAFETRGFLRYTIRPNGRTVVLSVFIYG